ncbi:ABC transporter ATP-binding protein [Mammaliicoccus sciuri]|nr:ABC transporter ATP-binding protein [Mammaliicoccus sciuri]MBF9296860.1 ABC transporter ATP-binding protein [Staphylococcus schleiferi]MCJ1764488.1 ABC transporter ATP-binding protein/permease [Mammaliicoccus sciuri]MCJ1773368.1 ABC transporter ATP-binding protein/permease [Mammaliicoccus sciuri]MCJ1782085.1 ABC transporter ATP-binding protein/permease [Mammaliicoccus sciuri]MDO0949303.1 ABC transporter ATP-binding protein [Mammaliicoccus sciuri]
MIKILLQSKKFILVTVLMTIVTSLLTVAIPILLTQVFYSNYKLNTNALYLVIIFMFITYMLQIFMVIIRENFALSFNKNYATDLYKKVYDMKYDEILKKEPTYLIDRVGQVVISLYFFVTKSLIGTLSNIIILITCLIIVFYINIYIAITLLLLIPLNYFGYKMINTKLQEKSLQMQKETSTGYKEIIAVYKNIDMMKQESYDRIENLISPSIERIYKSMAEVNKFGQSTSLVIELINTFVQNLTFFILAYLIIIGETKVEDLVIISVILPIYFISLQAFTNVNLELRDLLASKEFLDTEVQNNQEVTSDLKLESIRSIAFNNPTITINEREFRYHFSEAFYHGDIVFLEGHSGSGKSTLMKSVLNFRESSGIRINNMNVCDIEKNSLREKILYISQDMSILPMELKHNILYGKKDDNINWDTLKENIILESILKDKDINDNVYEGGTNFSGGEKQRLMLSRVLHEKVDCIILDEATSNIDKALENEIFKFITERYSDKIIFVISHDLENKKYCNKVIELNNNINT